MTSSYQHCSRCSNIISDQTLVKVGSIFLHESCLKCDICDKDLETSCYEKYGQLYCREDYTKMFGPKCQGCQNAFKLNEEIRSCSGYQYHLSCFQCSICQIRLETGMKFGAGEEGYLYCETHFNMLKERSIQDSQEDEEPSRCDTSFSSETGSSEEEQKPNLPESPEKSDKDNDEEDDDDEDKKEGKDGKRRGPRTTIKAKQLEMLRNIFNQNPKPTRAIREQLAKDTGLPMRVIQVWFQNKRSKEKRMHQLRMMSGPGMMFRPGMHPGMFPPPPNAVAFNFPPVGFQGGFQGDFPCYPPPQQEIYPSPPHMQGEFQEQSFQDFQDCYPSPPISDCSSPDQFQC